MTRIRTLARSHPAGVLLVVQLLGILLYPFVDRPANVVARSVTGAFGLLVLWLAIRTVRDTPLLTWVSWLIGLPCVILTVVDVVFGTAQPWHLASEIVHAIFYMYTFIALIAYMFNDDLITADDLLAVGATFTVGVWFFAYLYSICQIIVPGSFVAAVDSAALRSWFELVFLSCTTMTSTGLSDVVPVTPYARSLVMIQQITGMLYIAIVVARIVGLTLRRQAPVRPQARSGDVGSTPPNR